MPKLTQLTVLLMAGFVLFCPVGKAEIRSEAVKYQIDGQPFQGYLSFDDAVVGKRLGVLVVHEWWGHNAYARKRAEQLAKLGYVAFALDMYGAGKVADHPKDAQQYMEAALSNMKVAETRFNEAMKFLQKQPMVAPDKIAAIGYCFGGGIVSHMAKIGANLAAVISFHGSLASKDPAPAKGSIKAKILVLNGADDPFVTADQIKSFKQEIQNAGADYEFVNYPGVKHSFTNPDAEDYAKRFNMPLAYNADADKDSWQRMHQLLKQVFKQ
ncbi:dienelactone hydrolase family protein [Methyloglobulus sp.]|uniref:dienelactone hydrolase family protein n=1 Tax=Methyloglobulus sp. TaxID=2518622 RepID=UPI0032B87A14